MPVAVELRDVCFGYPGGPEVLHKVDLVVEAGEFVAIAGPNGGGKTTLLRVAVGLEQPLRGQALLFGEPTARFSRRSGIGYLAQRTELGIDAPISVREVVETGRVPRRGLIGQLRGGDRERVDEAIARVGLSDQAGSVLTHLSGGQQQRAYIAKALAADPDLLVLDEPTNGLDPAGIMEVRALLRELSSEGKTIFVSSHLLSEVEFISDWLVMIKAGGELLFEGPIHEALAHQQGRLIAAGEHAADLRSLLRLVEAIGYDAEVTDDQLLIDAPPEFAAELNRRAMADGLVLAELHYERPNLEEMFLTMTKEDDHAL